MAAPARPRTRNRIVRDLLARWVEIHRVQRRSAGGETQRCGWLKDKFGVTWQIVPSILGELLGDEDDAKSGRVMQAMLQMEKLDIQGLRQAYDRA